MKNRRRGISPYLSIRHITPQFHIEMIFVQKIGEYERLLVGMRTLTGWKPTDKQKFPRYMEIAQEVIHTEPR